MLGAERNCVRRLVLSQERRVSESLKSLLLAMINENPAKRPSCEEALSHSFFKV